MSAWSRAYSPEATSGTTRPAASDVPPKGPAAAFNAARCSDEGPFRVPGMRSNFLAKQFPGVVMLRRGVGEDGVDDSGGLMSDSGGIGGMFRAGCQINGFLFLRASGSGRRLHRHGLFL